jgi:hypothetical protein
VRSGDEEGRAFGPLLPVSWHTAADIGSSCQENGAVLPTVERRTLNSKFAFEKPANHENVSQRMGYECLYEWRSR